MQRQVALIKQSLFDQGFLDEQFMELEELQDDVNPNFVEEVATLYFKDSARLINSIDQALERGSFDFNRLDNYMHQFKGSSSRCLRTFQQVKKEHATLRKKLEHYFQLARQAGPKETARRSK
ncbi:histidine-containing phosphotransfer protein 4-like isoform X2 [Brassica napus]|uniref:histidine-containing phosphotransfer protein 4-like isoform X2 n=1 Tax=Brassica napus TaxID=3708 RepID=UPI0020786726|nr:histidine-containing phosphotransfer protein 4-like isoform X2 [Brassica napus]